MEKNRLVSVIITTKNESSVIKRLLDSIKKQSYKNIEVIVVDNNSSDSTKEIAKKYTTKVYNKGPERSVQRNYGVKKAKGAYVLILDADMKLSRNVIKDCISLINKNKVSHITIPEVSVASNYWEKIKAFEREFYNLHGDSAIEASRFFLKKAFVEVSGYDETITGPEDWDLPERLEKNGYKKGRIKSIIYHYERIPSLFSLFKKKYYYGLKSHIYFKSHNIDAISSKTIYFLRPVFYRNWRKLLFNPLKSVSMIVMLMGEQLAGGLGYFHGLLFKHNRVMILTAHYSPNIGGVETHLSDLVKALIKRKYDLSVVTYIPLTTDKNAALVETHRSLKIYRVPWLKYLFYALVKYPLLEFIYLLPGLFIVTPFIIILRRPRIIYSHGLVAGSVGLFWSKVFGIKSVLATHSLYEFPSSGLYRSYVRLLFTYTDRVLTLSKQSKREIERVSGRKDIIVFTYWIDLKRFASKKKHTKEFIVLFVGRLVSIKGIEVLVRAAQKWDKHIKLMIIGDGPLREFVDESSHKNKNIAYEGKVSNEKLPPYYQKASLTIVPSINEEGFGRVILESLACGTPIIASKKGGIPEAMNESVGKFIQPTEADIINTVEYYYSHTNKLDVLSRNARAYAKEKYSEQNVEKIITSFS